MLNKNEFKKIRKELEDFEKQREIVITKSREIIKLSKQIIYSLHRNNLKEAIKFVKEIKTKIKKLPHEHYDVNFNKVAFQEYVEAITYYEFYKKKKIPDRKSLNVSTEDYLLGLCDLTGELVRKAVNSAINKNYKEVFEIKELVSDIYEEFLKFNLRNGELRNKMDSIKWNLRKLEDLVLDIKVKNR